MVLTGLECRAVPRRPVPTVLSQAVPEDWTVCTTTQPAGRGAVLEELGALIMCVAEPGDNTAFKSLPGTAR